MLYLNALPWNNGDCLCWTINVLKTLPERDTPAIKPSKKNNLVMLRNAREWCKDDDLIFLIGRKVKSRTVLKVDNFAL